MIARKCWGVATGDSQGVFGLEQVIARECWEL